MKIGIDARGPGRGAGGVSTYVSQLTHWLNCLDRLDANWPQNNFLWNQLRPVMAGLHRGWDAYHAPGYTAPLNWSRPLFLSVHDISYLVNPAWYPYALGPLRRIYYRASILTADSLLVPSAFTAAELKRSFRRDLSKRISLVPLGVSDQFYPDPEAAEGVREEYSLPPRFLLHVGDLHARRNPLLLCETAARLDLPLVLVGRNLSDCACPRAMRLESLSLAKLRGLYSAASVFLYASLYEGFGLPLLEAMACGLPVVAADRAAVPEVVGDAGLLVEPQLESLAEAVSRMLAQPQCWIERGLQRASEMTWQKTADGTEAVYRELLD